MTELDQRAPAAACTQADDGWVCVPGGGPWADGDIVRVSACPPVALARQDGELVAFPDACPHLGALLSQVGAARGSHVVCGLHGKQFTLGKTLPRFAVVERDGCVHVQTRMSGRSGRSPFHRRSPR